MSSGHNPQLINIVSSVLGGCHIGIELSAVVVIEDVTAGQAQAERAADDATDAPPYDVAQLWHLHHPPSLMSRRVIVVRTSGGPRRLLVGEIAHVRTIPHSAICAVPVLLERAARRAAIKQLFVIDAQIGYLLQVDQFNDLTTNECTH